VKTEHVDFGIFEALREVLGEWHVVTHEERALSPLRTLAGPAFSEKGLAGAGSSRGEDSLVGGQADKHTELVDRCLVDSMEHGLVELAHLRSELHGRTENLDEPLEPILIDWSMLVRDSCKCSFWIVEVDACQNRLTRKSRSHPSIWSGRNSRKDNDVADEEVGEIKVHRHEPLDELMLGCDNLLNRILDIGRLSILVTCTPLSVFDPDRSALHLQEIHAAIR